MWGLIYNLGPFSRIIEFLLENLIPIKSETLELIRKKFLNIQDYNYIETYKNFIQLDEVKKKLSKNIIESISFPDEKVYENFKEKVEFLKNFTQI